MNDLLFYALLIALLYYFFYYLPTQKKTINPDPLSKPLTHSQFTQTDQLELSGYHASCPGPVPHPEAIKDLPKEQSTLLKDIQQKERTITNLNNSYSKLETKTQQAITKLKQQLQAKDNQIKELSETEKTIDSLIKGIQDLNQDLE
jgi:DNA repair exonuclease SbcCD ATPase subunit